jgi:hypothetical protein
MSTSYAGTTQGNTKTYLQQERSVNNNHLDLVERSIASLKAEAAAGTPIDHEEITKLEKQLNELRDRLGRR